MKLSSRANLDIGIKRGNFHITGDLLGNIFRSSTSGATPHNNFFMDGLYSLAGWVCYQYFLSPYINNIPIQQYYRVLLEISADSGANLVLLLLFFK